MIPLQAAIRPSRSRDRPYTARTMKLTNGALQASSRRGGNSTGGTSGHRMTAPDHDSELKVSQFSSSHTPVCIYMEQDLILWTCVFNCFSGYVVHSFRIRCPCPCPPSISCLLPGDITALRPASGKDHLLACPTLGALIKIYR